jgi:hypothetical protein
MTSLAVSAGRFFSDQWSARLSLGVLLDGQIRDVGGADHDLKPGGLVAVALERRASTGRGLTPSLDASISLSASWSETVSAITADRTPYSAADARLGARAVWQLGQRAFPFVAVRVFGGPVNWDVRGDTVLGSDIHHYQLAVGSAVQLGTFAGHVEWAALGEQGVSAGLSTMW